MIQVSQVNPNYYYPEAFKEQGDKFLDAYTLEMEFGCPKEKVKGLRAKKDRVCRFCQKKYPHASFSKDAHILSEMLGNKYWVSDFECDSCNLIFSRYENDLANFLGIVRTVQSVKGKKLPKFKSADKKLEIESSIGDDGTTVKFRRFEGLNNTFHFDKEKNATVTTYQKPPYIPWYVYKALLKMALSVMPDFHMSDYKFACEFLRSKKHDSTYSGFAILSTYTMPYTYQFQQPCCMLFRKTDPNSNTFTHVFYLAALNFIYQIVLPFNRRDAALFYSQKDINTFWCPPLFGHNEESRIQQIYSNSVNLNSTEKLSNEIESLILPAQPGEFEVSRFQNPETGEYYEEPFVGENIIGIDLQRIEIEE